VSFFVCDAVGFFVLFVRIRDAVFAVQAVWFACGFSGIRVLPSRFKRRPCAGRHLLFFAAA
jgi:hypothetical protein